MPCAGASMARETRDTDGQPGNHDNQADNPDVKEQDKPNTSDKEGAVTGGKVPAADGSNHDNNGNHDNDGDVTKETGPGRETQEQLCEALEKQHVHRVYHQMAHHFKDVRFKAWPKVKQFLLDLEPGSLVADVGCGNGKYLHINKSILKFGSDQCSRLVDIAGSNAHEVMVADNLTLPYRDSCFDAVVSIAVIHHFTTAGRRVQAIRELARILKPGGKVMIYVWAMEQKHRKFKSQDVLVPWHFKAKPPKRDKSKLTNGNSISSTSQPASSPEESYNPRTKYSRKKGAPPQTSRVHATGSPSAEERNGKSEPSISQTLRAKFLELIGSKSPERETVCDPGPEPEERTAEVPKLEHVIKEQEKLYKIPRPILEHSLSASEIEGFAIREFPMSSRPSRLSKQASWDPSPAPWDPQPQEYDPVLSQGGSDFPKEPFRARNIEKQFKRSKLQKQVHVNAVPKDMKNCLESSQQNQSVSEVGHNNERSCNSHNLPKLNQFPTPKEKRTNRQQMNLSFDTNGVKENSDPKAKLSPSRKDPIANGSSKNGQSNCESRKDVTQPGLPYSELECEWMKNTERAIQSMQSHVEQMEYHGAQNGCNGKCAEKKTSGTNGSFQVSKTVSSNGKTVLKRRPRISSDTSSISSISSLSSDTDASDVEDLGGVCSFCTKPDGSTDNDACKLNGSDLVSPTLPDAPSKSHPGDKNDDVNGHNEGGTSSQAAQVDNPPTQDKTTESENGDISKDSSKRFYHVFKEQELVDLITKNIECLHIIDSYYDHANWCVIAEKVNVWTF